jgi:HK97 family phage major capsid protein
MRAGLDKAFLQADGVNKPMGLVNRPGAVKVNRDTANQISYDDLVTMWSRFYSGFSSPTWIVSRSAIPQLANVRDTGNNNLWIQNAPMQIPVEIFGAPVVVTNRVPTLGSRGGHPGRPGSICCRHPAGGLRADE